MTLYGSAPTTPCSSACLYIVITVAGTAADAPSSQSSSMAWMAPDAAGSDRDASRVDPYEVKLCERALGG